MKRYRVFLYNAPPLSNATGARIAWYSHLSKAQLFAEAQKNKWTSVCIDKKISRNMFKRIEHFYKGRRYTAADRAQ